MAYGFIIDKAIEMINKRYDKGHNPVMGDTVCVVLTADGKIYTGQNRYVYPNNSTSGIQNNIHAEEEAVRSMKADGEKVIRAITVFDSCSGQPILPCNGCINLIMSLDQENVNSLIVTPSGNIRITDVHMYAAPVQMHMNMPGYSVYNNIPEHNRGASLYTNPGSSYVGHDDDEVRRSLYTDSRTAENPEKNSGIQTADRFSGRSSILKERLNSLLGE